MRAAELIEAGQRLGFTGEEVRAMRLMDLASLLIADAEMEQG